MDFASRLSRVEANDLSLVQLEVDRWTRGIPDNRAELVQRVVAALGRNTHIKKLRFFALGLIEGDVAPLAELLKTRDFEQADLADNKLTGEILFPALTSQKSLRVLRLGRNKSLAALEHLSALINLKELDLSDCGLSAVPPAVLQMPHLEVLKLNGNSFKTLPAAFASFSNLKQLNMSECGLSEFPAVLLRLTHLEKLDISWNNLTSIPDGIAALVNLKSFVASRCGLDEFPVAVIQLAHLEHLKLSSNSDVKRVPEEIGNLQRLKVLRLSGCGLTELPDSLWTLADLETLDLSENPLTSVPGGIGALSELRLLEMNNSAITKLPSEIQQLSSLESLNISSAEITRLPVWLASLRSLRELRCSYNPLVGVAVNENTLVTYDELAALVSNSSDPEEVGKLKESFEEMLKKDPLRLLLIANTHFAPRTPLRALCVSKCVAQHSRADLQRLPTHIRDEIVRGVGEQQS